jgi:hypothetical protein
MASVLIATDDFCALEKPLWPRLMAVALNRDEKAKPRPATACV